MKLLKGTFRGDRAAKNEWKPDPLTVDEAIAAMPKGLPGPARAVWKQLAPQLAGASLLARADMPAFLALCLAYARAVQAEQETIRDGFTITTDKGFMLQHPAVAIARTSWTQFRQYAQEFGLTPSARSRVEAVPPAKPAADAAPATRFRFGRGA